MKPKLMLIGVGDLGSVLLELLAVLPAGREVVVGSRNLHAAESRCNIARLGALSRGLEAHIRVIHVDLTETDRTAETIAREHPDIILSTATMLTWWHAERLSPVQKTKLRSAGFGVWLPVHLAPTMQFMRAVRRADFKGFALTAPFPDAVNCALGKVGLAPTCGIGNIAEIVAKVRMQTAKHFKCATDRISVTLVAHHALEEFAFRAQESTRAVQLPPYLMQLKLDGNDVTTSVDCDELILSSCSLGPARDTRFLTANTAVHMIQALGDEVPTRLHVPGPHGMPGGYPVVASNSGVELALGEFSEAQAVAVNEASHRFDGIETIETDGTVVINPERAEILREQIGYHAERITIGDVEAQAVELTERFRQYAKS